MITSNDEQFNRYAFLKNAIYHLANNPQIPDEIWGKALNIFHYEIEELEESLLTKGFMFDKEICVNVFDLPLVFLKNDKGEHIEQGFRADKVMIIINDKYLKPEIPKFIKTINNSTLNPPI